MLANYNKDKANHKRIREDSGDNPLKDALLNLVKSISREESPLARLIKEEADKIEAYQFPTNLSNDEIGHMGSNHNNTLKDVLLDLLKSIAREENALAHLIKAEADKIEAFVGKNCDFPTHPSNDEIIELNRSVTKLLETIIMKEWLLLKKLEDILEFIKKKRKQEE